MLRAGLLAGVDAWVASPDGSPTAARLRALGAAVHPLVVDPFGDEPPVAVPAAPGDGLPVCVWDGEAALAAAAPGVAGVHAALDGAWLAVRAVATTVMHPGERGGKVVLQAPWPGDAHRAAARAGLENLSRTLGIEWARLGVRTVTLEPGPRTDAAALAELTGFLASRAGDYFSGTALTLS